MRNASVTAYLATIVQEDVLDLVELAVGRALLKDDACSRTISDVDADGRAWMRRELLDDVPIDVEQKIMHVRDWISTSVKDGAPWLSRRDGSDRPLKLLKFGSLDQAVREADKAMRVFASAHSVRTHLDEGEETRLELDEGWRIVRLTSATALDRESGAMGHCIGSGSYDAKMASEESDYLSLRDPANQPHATAEVVVASLEVRQLVGKQNRPLHARHLERLRPWLGTVDIGSRAFRSNVYDEFFGIFRSADGTVHHRNALPEDFVFVGRLGIGDAASVPKRSIRVAGDLVVSAFERPATMPRSTEVSGNLVIRGDVIFADDAVLVVGGSIVLAGAIPELPGSDVASLTLSEMRLERLPEISVGFAELVLVRCTIGNLEIPPGCGKLVLDASRVDRIEGGADLGILVLSNDTVLGTTPLLPKLTTLSMVRSSVGASGGMPSLSSISMADSSSEGLATGPFLASIEIRASRVGPLPEGLGVGRLSIADSPDVVLPRRMVVERADLRGSKCPAFGEGTEITGPATFAKLDFGHVAAEVARIGGDVEIRSCVSKTPLDALHVDGSVLIEDWRSGPVARRLVCGGDMRMVRSESPAIADVLCVGGRLHVVSSRLGTPAGRMIVGGSMVFEQSKAANLGSSCRIGGSLQLVVSEIGRIPQRTSVGGSLSCPTHSRIDFVGCGLRVAGELKLPGGISISIGEELSAGSVRFVRKHGCDVPITLPRRMRVSGELDVSECVGIRVPEDAVCGRIVREGETSGSWSE